MEDMSLSHPENTDSQIHLLTQVCLHLFQNQLPLPLLVLVLSASHTAWVFKEYSLDRDLRNSFILFYMPIKCLVQISAQCKSKGFGPQDLRQWLVLQTETFAFLLSIDPHRTLCGHDKIK